MLSRLAELYQCAVADLVVDLPDFRATDAVLTAAGNLSGEWLSTYSYYSSGRQQDLRGEQDPGTWSERTSSGGYYRGADYHGTAQLVVSPHGRALVGRWLGFGKEFNVNTGEWRLEWIGQ
ncbi:hypothetical protein HPO96_14815 [Kribbella sandramycini]|uniref:DNA-binding protein n=1 Tax=Kribbella sandramycini TaxID=60450 RepID=A0A7Y4L138_9ACTN|nr:hypothetical protein [Kribbella sandramycini]MBB6565247.1 hypothetical protein [Kribbella sandramycini]NOL41516.1 hypothetical protein [Kribbella sandramycini]